MRKALLLLAAIASLAVAKASAAEEVLFENWNRSTCAYTNLSVFVLDAPAKVSRIELWYDWAADPAPPFLLWNGEGKVVLRGTLARGDCDPNQRTWCQARADLRGGGLSAGSYMVQVGGARQCRNAASGGNGFVRVVGQGGAAGAPAANAPAAAGAGSYVGCFKDTDQRDLKAFTFNDAAMTTEKCVQSCATRGYAYAATQFAAHCFCDNRYGAFGAAANCDMACSGNGGQTCGGAWANSVYRAR